MKHLAIVLVLGLAACGNESDPSFEFVARFDPAGASLVVDGMVNPRELAYVFESYEAARAELVIAVSIQTSQGSAVTAVRPGICDERLTPMQIDVGRMLRERVVLEVIDGPTPTLGELGYTCIGTELSVWTTRG